MNLVNSSLVNSSLVNLSDHIGAFVSYKGQEWMLVHVDIFEQTATFENEDERHVRLSKKQAIDLIIGSEIVA